MPCTPKDCYQVKVNATMTSELKCLHEKLGVEMFCIEVTCPTEVPLNPEILEVEFDKCDCSKVTFTVRVELPGELDVSECLVNVVPAEHRITTKGHKNPVSVVVFTVHPLPRHVSSRGFDTECYDYEICRVPCTAETTVCPDPLCTNPNSFRVVFPLSQEVACLVPDFGLSGFYLKNLVSSSLKTKVRLCPANSPPKEGCGGIPGALLSYDPERCEACLEFCDSQDEYECITKGYEHLFNYSGTPPMAVSIEDMALTRRFNVKGVSKCTETTLLSFELCFKPPFSESAGDVMNYKIVPNVEGETCYEFFCKEVVSPI